MNETNHLNETNDMDNINNRNNEAPNLLSEKLFSLLLRCSHALSRGHHHSAGIHPGQQRVLSLLASSDKMKQSDLLDTLQIRAASLSELLTKLEGKGLITRTKSDGTKRGIDVEITDLGEMVAAEYTRDQQETTGKLFSVLSEEEQKQMIELLSRLVEDWHNRHHCSYDNGSQVHEHGRHMHKHGDNIHEHCGRMREHGRHFHRGEHRWEDGEREKE